MDAKNSQNFFEMVQKKVMIDYVNYHTRLRCEECLEVFWQWCKKVISFLLLLYKTSKI